MVQVPHGVGCDPHDRPRRRLCTRASALAKIVFFVYICTVIVF